MTSCRTLVVAVGVVLPVLLPQTSSAQDDPVTFDWRRFGARVATEAKTDPTIRRQVEGSEEALRKHIAHEVGQKLNAMGVMPNTNNIERGVSWTRYGNQAIGTCQHVSDSLKAAMIGGGLEEGRLVRVFGQKPLSRVRGPFDVNTTHMALAYSTLHSSTGISRVGGRAPSACHQC